MVLFFVITLLVGIAGVAGLIGVKQWELHSGRMLGASLRPAAGGFFRATLQWFEHVLPALLQSHARRLWNEMSGAAQHIVARGILWAEETLERALRGLRHSTDVARRPEGEASPFLREVAEHKKKLQEDTKAEHSIKEE